MRNLATPLIFFWALLTLQDFDKVPTCAGGMTSRHRTMDEFRLALDFKPDVHGEDVAD
jgi:hypothetical protein